MEKRKIRIGIDVGGTFTHAIALDYQTYELVAHAVTPTTHTSEYSVSEGIIKVFEEVLEKSGVSGDDVVFVAHSTTQATNALLEGDVAKVGVIGMGKGLEAIKAKTDTNIGNIELSIGKLLQSYSTFIDTSSDQFDQEIDKALETIKKEECDVVVASEAFGVDDTTNEDKVVEMAEGHGFPSTASHEISQLYGLKVRTRTAVINASILPKMTETADLTNVSIHKSGIKAPLMIMRSDGGVMDIDQMKIRPILTLLSGPAAGIAAALMYANISYGIFLEVGGTSTDISAIKNGRAMIKSASIGGHTTYLKTLDSRTVGIGGGSMVRLNKQGMVNDTGPRSAHIAGYTYVAFAPDNALDDAEVISLSPMPGDPDDYIILANKKGERYALTLTDAAMMAGVSKPGDYAYGNIENVKKAFEILSNKYNRDKIELARDILEHAVKHIKPVVDSLIADYELDVNAVSLVGGGGGCCCIVPFVAEKMSMKYLIAENAHVISAIGAAMALLRDMVERNIVNPSEADIASVRKQAIDSLLKMGADPNGIEVHMEIDGQRNIVRAIATGSIEMKNKDFGKPALSDEEIMNLIKEENTEKEIIMAGKTSGMRIYRINEEVKKLLFKSKKQTLQVRDQFGTVRLNLVNGDILSTSAGNWKNVTETFLKDKSDYSDAGQTLPEVYLIYGNRVADYASILGQNEVISLIGMELEGVNLDDNVYILIKNR